MNKTVMKTSNLIVLIGVALLFALSLFFQGRVHYHVKKERAAGFGLFESQKRDIAHFDSIEVSDRIKVVFTQDSTTTLNVWGPSAFLDSIQTTVLDSKLQINLNAKIKTKDTITIAITNNSLSGLVLEHGYFENEATLNTEKIKLKMDKNSTCKLALRAKTLEVDMAKGAGLELNGKTEEIIFINQ